MKRKLNSLKMAINDYKKSDCTNRRIIKNGEARINLKKLTWKYCVYFLEREKSINFAIMLEENYYIEITCNIFGFEEISIYDNFYEAKEVIYEFLTTVH